MNSAKAAAAASTPNIRGGVYLDSYDARIIEYQYAIVKLEALIKHIKSLQIKLRVNPTLIPLVQYMVTLTGPILNISDILARRLEQLGKLIQLEDLRKVAPAANTSALNFEIDDQTPISVKYTEESRQLLTSLLSLYENGLSIYEKKLQQAILERDANRLPGANNKPVSLDLSSFSDLFEPIELNVFPKLIVDPQELENYHFKRVPLVIDSINKSIKILKTYIEQLKQYKQRPNDMVLKKLPHWHYTIHRIFATFVKLSELYTILRKFGRELYIPEDKHLHNPKILHNNVKLELSLSEADEYLKGTRKNQQLSFVLAKGTRQGSYSHLKNQTIIELTNTLIPSGVLISKLSLIILNFTKNWESAETKLSKIEEEQKQRERTSKQPSPTNGLPSKKVEVLFNPEKEKLSQEYIAKQQRERERVAAEDRLVKEKAQREKQLQDEKIAKRKIEEREKKLRDELIKDRESSPNVSRQSSIRKTTRIRSNSNSSVSSASSNSSLNALSRNDSIGSPRITSPTALSRSSSLKSKRPASVYMSSPAFDIRTQLRRQQAAAATVNSPTSANSFGTSSPPVIGRRRSSSLQSSLPSAEHNNSLLAAAAGAAALKQERHSSLKSQSEVTHQQHLAEKQQHLQVRQNQQGARGSRSPSPSPRIFNGELPNINELALHDSPSKVKRPLKSALVNKRSQNAKPKNATTAPVSQSLTVPDLINETTSESSDNTSDQNTQDISSSSPKSLETIRVDVIQDRSLSGEASGDDDAPVEEPEPKPIVKKVRFTGVPDEIEEVKPKRKGWIRPPRLMSNANTQKSRSALSTAADALQQEGVIFHNIKRGKLDVNTGAIVIPDTSNKRIMNTLAASTNNNHRLGRWKLGK